MNEDTKVQDNNVEGQPQSGVHTDSKPTEDLVPSERTGEQFDKLLQRNKDMATKLAAYEAKEQNESVLDSLKPKQAPIDQSAPTNFVLPQFGKKQVEQDPDLVDPEGYINADVLKKNLSDAQLRAQQAEKEAKATREQFVKYEETQQTKIAHEKYPQLDPHSEKFDRRFYDLTRNELIGQMMQGKKDVLAAAKRVTEYYTAPEKKSEEENSKEALEQKQQINAGKKTASQPSEYSGSEDKDLIRATRLGKKGALAERLKRSGN